MRQKWMLLAITLLFFIGVQGQVSKWEKMEIQFTSDKSYENPIYDVENFSVQLQSPTGRQINLNGFWDGDTNWKFRFAPDETGTWQYRSICSDEQNAGLHNKTGLIECLQPENELKLYKNGPVIHPSGTYYLAHYDGTPFFWAGCTAWNGALKSTDEEWNRYLAHRKENNYSVIQFVTTQWRGCDANSLGQKAFTGSGRISVDPAFFQYLDQKIDKINEYGLLAAPVLLWALPFGAGRELSPGFYLPVESAVKLARYIVARYQGNQVVWLLGGDGRYFGQEEDRWKAIGSQVFTENTPGLATLHPHGLSWVGDIYDDQPWYDIVGYQSSHSNKANTVNWINTGPVARKWDEMRPRPVINMEPNYEEIFFTIDDRDVRNASYWSLFATPIAGITYGANGIWPWLRKGENILNHEDATGTTPWSESIDFPGSMQIGYLSAFIQEFEWWKFRPANELLIEQPGTIEYNHFVSVSQKLDQSVLLCYLPAPMVISLRNPHNYMYSGEWFDPINNTRYEAKISDDETGVISVTLDEGDDRVLILRRK